MKTEYFRMGQPHFQPIGAQFHVVLLAYDTVPVKIIRGIVSDRLCFRFHHRTECNEDAPTHEHNKQIFSKQNRQEYSFTAPQARRIILKKLKQYQADRYELLACCIMSNHIHILLDLSVQVPCDWDGVSSIKEYQNLGRIIGMIKGGAAYEINKLDRRKRNLWSPGYYDRYIRNEKHLWNTWNYIINNPVKAGIVRHWQDFPGTFLHPVFCDL